MEVSFAELVCEGYLRPPIDPILGLGVPSKPIAVRIAGMRRTNRTRTNKSVETVRC